MLRKLAFAHHTLWRRDETYRLAFVLGPPVLAGSLIGAILWFGWQAVPVGDATSWARPEPTGNLPHDGTAIVEAPFAPLPQTASNGLPVGLEPGWDGAIQPVKIEHDLDVNVLPTRSGGFVLPAGPVDLHRIISAGPAGGLFVGVATGLFVVNRAGTYALTLKLSRNSENVANCLMRLGMGSHRILSRYELNVGGNVEMALDPVTFELQPGIYKIALAFGCWRDGQTIGPGEVTLLVRHPGETRLAPAGPADVMRSTVPPA